MKKYSVLMLLFLFIVILGYTIVHSQENTTLVKKKIEYKIEKDTKLPFDELSGIWQVVPIESEKPEIYVLTQKLKYLDFSKYLSKTSYYDFTYRARFYITPSNKDDQAAGLIFRFRNSFKYYMVYADAKDDEIDLIRNNYGKKIIHKEKHPIDTDKWYTLAVQCTLETITVSLDDKVLFTLNDKTSTGGKIGLTVYKESKAYFKDILIDTEVVEIGEDLKAQETK